MEMGRMNYQKDKEEDHNDYVTQKQTKNLTLYYYLALNIELGLFNVGLSALTLFPGLWNGFPSSVR